MTGPHGTPDEVVATADLVLATPFEAATMLALIASSLEREVDR